MAAAVETSNALANSNGLLRQVASAYATEAVPIARPQQRIGELRAGLAGLEFDSAEDVVVLEVDRLVGVISIEALLAADSNATVEDIMDTDPPTVAPDTDQEPLVPELAVVKAGVIWELAGWRSFATTCRLVVA
jgi:CBS domain-containing protein